MKSYVSVLALSEDLESVALLKKLKGPEHLIGKWTIPGGNVDKADASLSDAAAREFDEETGCSIPANKMIQILKKGNEHFELTVFFAIGNIAGAKQQPGEIEPIEVRSWAEVRARVAAGDTSYVGDFAEIIEAIDNSPAVAAAQAQAFAELSAARATNFKKGPRP